MSINEADKPTVGSATSEIANEQLSEIPVLPATSIPATQIPITVLAPTPMAAAAASAMSGSGTEIGEGATAADYTQAEASSENGSANKAPSSASNQNDGTPSSDNGGYSNQAKSANDLQKGTLSQYLTNAANPEQYNRILQIVEDWTDNAGCDKSKLLEALEKERLKDSMHYLQTVIVIMHDVVIRSSGVPYITERGEGQIKINFRFSDTRFNRAVRLLSLVDGSIRVSYLYADNRPGNPERLFENTPDADAQEIVNSVMEWVTPNYQNVNA